MVSKKEHIKRSVMDRRSFLDRRMVNLGPKYPEKEQRRQKARRQGLENRYEWKSIDQWSSFPISLKMPQSYKSQQLE